MSVGKLFIALSLGAPFFAAETTIPDTAGLIVHEWGTFTSVAAKGGEPEHWTALSGPSDLPCFVHRLPGPNVKYSPLAPPYGAPWTVTKNFPTVRMETPVLYLYTRRKMALSVQVAFPQGMITEWYPKATNVQPDSTGAAIAAGRIDWNGLEVSPGEEVQLPSSVGPSHYYAARNTDAAPIRYRDEREKMIFYRGIGNFDVPLRARFTESGAVELRNIGAAVPAAMLFENRGGKIGFRNLKRVDGSKTVELPALTGDLGSLGELLTDTLVELGLYRKEAAAMIETWRDSWFEEGTRVIYAVPRAVVDEVLPLTVTPAPVSVSRVFVGRIEMLSPAAERSLRAALASGDNAVLAKFGRFLQPFLARIGPTELSRAAADFIQLRYQAARREFYAPGCAQ